MYTITDLKPGRAITVDGEPYLVVSSQFGRKSQSKANMQCKLKHLKTGAVLARNFQGSEKIEPADVGYRRMQYLFRAGDQFTFMDQENYEQFELNLDSIEDAVPFLIEGGEADAVIYNDMPIGIQLKPTVDMKVIETMPGVKGDTASGGNKPATLESGLTVNVPLFINVGDKVRVNTETQEYMSRVS